MWIIQFFFQIVLSLFAVIQVENKMNADYNNDNYTYDAEDENQLTLPAGFPYLVNDTTTNTQLSFATYSAFQNLLYGDTLLAWVDGQDSSDLRISYR